MSCFTRSFYKEADGDNDNEKWLSQQLKATRAELCKKSDFCDQLASRLRDMETDLTQRSSAVHEVRELLSASNAELRAAGRARQEREAEHSELCSVAESLRAEADALRAREVSTEALAERARESEQAREAEVIELTKRLAEQELAAQREVQLDEAKAACLHEAAEFRSAVREQCFAEGAACTHRLREEAAEMQRTIVTLSAAAVADGLASTSAELAALNKRLASEETEGSQLKRPADDLVSASPTSKALVTEDAILPDADTAAGKGAFVEPAATVAPSSPLARERSKAERLGSGGSYSDIMSVDNPQVELEVLHKAIREAAEREAELKEQLRQEKELHEGAVRKLRSREQKKNELDQELANLSGALEQKEEDVINIQFDMVDLQNALVDQVRLVSENADAFQQASEELADKDERLRDALERQEDLMKQMNELSSKLQGKVELLSQELDRSRAAYQALDDQTRATVLNLEQERDGLLSELSQLRADSASEVALLRAELQEAKDAGQRQAAAKELSRALRRKDEGLQEALRAEKQRAEDLQDQLIGAKEKLSLADTQLRDLAAALERAQFIERQALERAQEYRTSFELYREFGKEDFMQDDMIFPGPRIGNEVVDSPQKAEAADSPPTPALTVLVAVELDLGFTTATLSVAPWQTKADFDAVVQQFLEEHRVRPVFANALVRYLEEVEADAVTFPTVVSANLVDLYSRYS